MNRRKFLVSVATIPLAHSICSPACTPGVSPAVVGNLTSSTTAEPLMDSFRLSMERVLHGTGPAYSPEFLLEDIYATPGRRFTEFSGDVSGRWVGAMATAAAVYGQTSPFLDDVVHRIIALQHPDGYFGKVFHFDHPDDTDLALLWGNGRLLVGLMEYYELKKAPDVIAAARRLGDFLLRIAPAFNSKEMAEAFSAAHFASSYICWTQQTEGLAALFAATGDIRYRDLCAAISERMERRPADHVHGYLCSLRGTVDLYRVTNDQTHLKRVEAAWRDIMHSGDVLITGGVPEAWSPKKKRTEGCAESDWLRLNLALWRVTGKVVYLDAAERVLFNEFAMNQFSTGDFGHAMLNESGVPTTVYVRAWWCCTLHGLRAFPDVHRSVFRMAMGEVFYDLPIDGRAEGDKLMIEATSTLATNGTVCLHVIKAEGQRLTIRKPSWAQDLKLAVDGHPVEGLSVALPKAGGIVTARYSMALHEDKPSAGRQAFSFGPWLLGAASSANPGYFNELHPENKVLTESARAAAEVGSLPFNVPIAATRMAYLPAEFPEQPSQVVLHAVAEQTAMLPTQWQIVFVAKSEA